MEMAHIRGVDGMQLVPEVFDDVDATRDIASEIGRVVANLIVARLVHRDLKLSNLIVERGAKPRRVWVVDTADVRPMRHPVADVACMLDRLVIEMHQAGIGIPRAAWRPVLLSSFRQLSKQTRRGVVQRLRQRRPR